MSPFIWAPGGTKGQSSNLEKRMDQKGKTFFQLVQQTLRLSLGTRLVSLFLYFLGTEMCLPRQSSFSLQIKCDLSVLPPLHCFVEARVTNSNVYRDQAEAMWV